MSYQESPKDVFPENFFERSLCFHVSANCQRSSYKDIFGRKGWRDDRYTQPKQYHDWEDFYNDVGIETDTLVLSHEYLCCTGPLQLDVYIYHGPRRRLARPIHKITIFSPSQDNNTHLLECARRLYGTP